MEGFGQILNTLLSRPRLTWAALALASAGFLALSLSPLLSLGHQAHLLIVYPIALAIFLIALAFFTLSLVIDLAKVVGTRFKRGADDVRLKTRFEKLSPDAKGLLKFLAVTSENIITLDADHPAIIPLRSANFLYVSGSGESTIELETRMGVFEWLQKNLDWLNRLEIPEDAEHRLRKSIELAQERNKYSWMA